MKLIERAKIDYQEGRHYSVVLGLLAVMDGFVNDLDPQARRGLHAREADEMSAWDSVVGHHLGLTNAHKTFIKGFYMISRDEVHELYRNGIMHGMLTNFDNDVVSTKAWNRLFAVGDWATSLERQAVPPKPEPTWSELAQNMRKNAETKEALESWRPRITTERDQGSLMIESTSWPPTTSQPGKEGTTARWRRLSPRSFAWKPTVRAREWCASSTTSTN
jgi:hypothetical protein